MVYKHFFGRTPEGQAVTRFTLFNHNTMEVNLLNFGAAVHSICVPDKNGTVAEVTLGCDTIADYIASPHFGGTIGRVANRIAGASFPLNGREYPLAANDGENHLHGGACGFDRRLWQWSTEDVDNVVVFSRTAPSGEEGYPGRLHVEVRYCLTQQDALIIHYTATAEEGDTLLNLTNHTYFNLAGQGDILDHRLELAASRFTPVDGQRIPTGEIAPVAGTPLDFTTPHRIGERIAAPHPQLQNAGGYDHNFLLDYDADGKNPLHPAAELSDPVSGRRLTVFTTEPALQLYTGNFLAGERGRGGAPCPRYGGLCLETQHYPDSPHHPAFPSILLRQGETYESETVWFFGLMD
ncbi:MAG: aldose epimerase family protein [Angelakisella sp.]